MFHLPTSHQCFRLYTEKSKRPVSFESRGNMREELDTLRATIDIQNHFDSNSTGTHTKTRHKRFLSYPRYVELMVTADAKMVRHHGPNLEHYILTIMSVVSEIMFLIFFLSLWNMCFCALRCIIYYFWHMHQCYCVTSCISSVWNVVGADYTS